MAAAVGYLSLSSRQTAAEEPTQAEAKSPKLKELLKERLTALREIARLTTLAAKSGTAPYEQVLEATRRLLGAELERCDTDKEWVTVLEKFVGEAKKHEEYAAHLSRTGQAPARIALQAKADRLQAEIFLERARARAAAKPK
jgi:hypothetical protein